MSNGIVENPEGLKKLYLNTNLSDVAAVQSAIKEVKENVYVEGKEKYLVALNAATPANIAKARRYNNLPAYLRYLGWGLIVIFFIAAMIFDDSGLFEDSTVTWPYVGIWIGIGVQIYIAVLKSAWTKLTLSGSVIHPVLRGTANADPIANSKIAINQKMTNQQQPVGMAEGAFCSECGRKNKSNAQYCENCGAKL